MKDRCAAADDEQDDCQDCCGDAGLLANAQDFRDADEGNSCAAAACEKAENDQGPLNIHLLQLLPSCNAAVKNVGRSRLRISAEFGQVMHVLGTRFGDFLRHNGFGIVEVTKESGAGAAIVNACGLALAVGCEMRAQRALLDNLLFFVERANSIRAGHHAVLAANALGLVYKHHTGFGIAVRGARGAYVHALGILALLALSGQPIQFHIGEIAGRANGKNTVPVLAQGDIVLKLAGDNAGVAAGAAVEIDYKAFSH